MDFAIGALFLLPFYLLATRLYLKYYKTGVVVESDQLMDSWLELSRLRRK